MATSLRGDGRARHRYDLDGEGELAQQFDPLAFVHDADETSRGRHEYFFPGQRCAAALDQAPVVVGLVGAVHVEVQRAALTQGRHLESEAVQQIGGRLRAGSDGRDPVADFREEGDELVGGAARAHAQAAILADVLNRGPRGMALGRQRCLFVGLFRSQSAIPSLRMQRNRSRVSSRLPPLYGAVTSPWGRGRPALNHRRNSWTRLSVITASTGTSVSFASSCPTRWKS